MCTPDSEPPVFGLNALGFCIQATAYNELLVMSTQQKILFIAGNQLFPLDVVEPHKDAVIFMTEDYAACTYLRHHKHKLVLILAAMRAYADQLRKQGYTVHYERLDDNPKTLSITDKLDRCIAGHKQATLLHFDMQDKSMARRMARFAKSRKLTCEVLPSPMFMTPRDEFRSWREQQRAPRMVNFYRWQRRRLKLLMTPDDKPVGGKWSFDNDNRKALPADVDAPSLPSFNSNRHLKDVKQLVEKEFAEHPGEANNFDLPTTHAEAQQWLQDFLQQRFSCFGSFEDALTSRSDYVFHSVLSPLLNIGLLTPEDVVKQALSFADKKQTPINSVEGFIRQLIGWREFMFGIYCTDGDTMKRGNFFRHRRRLTAHWYQGTTGLLPLDQVIHKANRIGYAHHIERLMVAGNLMLLSEVHPDEVYRWFMEMFVDAADWVMIPNVYGMALYADGGTITTKPYFCGSNYLLKMGDYPKGEWTTTLDALFWRFMARNREFFAKQPRLGMLCGHLDRQSDERRKELSKAATQFLRINTACKAKGLKPSPVALTSGGASPAPSDKHTATGISA